MSFLHPALIFGFTLVAVPVVLHLWMRPRPKKLMFPALRLLQARQRQNSRRLRLRHLWLLLLRMAVLALMVLAVMRPTLPPANYALTWTETIVAAVILGGAAAAYFGMLHNWNQRRWPRHVWLTRRTILRGSVGAIAAALLLLAVAWPYQRRVAAEIVAPPSTVRPDLPVTAVYLFDTSLSMEFQRQNQTRLQVAVELAGRHLGTLPPQSKVAVADSAGQTPIVFSDDASAAQNRLDGLKPHPVHRPLEDRLRAAIQAVEHDRKKLLSDQSAISEELQQDRFLREIYVFTDLAKSAWQGPAGSQLREELAARPWLALYVVDVGVDDPLNISLTNVRLSRDAVPAGGMFTVEATLRSVGASAGERTIELEQRDDGGDAVKAGQQTVQLPANGEALVKFPLEAGTGRFRQGELKIVGADPLVMDDRQYFTIRVLPSRRVLVVSDSAGEVDVWMTAMASLGQGKRTAFAEKFVATEKLASVDLENYDAVCLINAGRPEPEAWEKLKAFVETGGGLFIALGASFAAEPGQKGIHPLAYNSIPAAQELLPATLKGQTKLPPATTFDLRERSHPLLERLDELGAIPELSAMEVRRYWSVTPDATATVIAPYATDARQPALLERAVGQGRVLMLTTAVNSNAWNDLMGGGENAWVYLAWIDQVTAYLNAAAHGRSNGMVGAPMTVRITPEPNKRTCVLRMPDFKQLPKEIPSLAETLTLRDLTSPGQYELASADDSTKLVAAFSLNLSGNESDLTKFTTDELDLLFGEQRYSLSRTLDDLVRSVQAGRLGKEVYGLVLAILVAVFVMEQIVGAWFYRTDETSQQPAETIRSVIKSNSQTTSTPAVQSASM